MKSRLAASINLLRVGACRGNVREMSSRSMFSLFDCALCKNNSSFQALGFESSGRALHSYEDFSELGPEISEFSAKNIKLVTEKPDILLSTHPSKNDFRNRSLYSDKRPRVNEIVATMRKDSPSSNYKVGVHSHASTSTNDTNRISDKENPNSVSVMNILPTIGLCELIGALSVFGKVSGASFVTTSNGVRCCNIEFEDVDASKRAILAGKIAVGSHVFQVQSLDAANVVAIRIQNINRETSDFAIHLKCKSLGGFVGLGRTSKDVVDAVFKVRDDETHLKIIKKLNKTQIDSKQWSADVLEIKSNCPEASSHEEDRYKLNRQILGHVSNLKQKLILQKIYLEDLEALNASIIHVEGLHPRH